MGTITLILFAFASPIADGNAMALAHVDGFKTVSACQEAGRNVKNMSSMTRKIEFVCVDTGR